MQEKEQIYFQLNNGVSKIPALGLGTWLSEKEKVGDAVKAAVRMGYRHIDCAQNYLNEAEIGDALSELFKEGFKRSDLFITSKLGNNYHHKEHVEGILDKTLKDLNLEYLDLWLMHWPLALNFVPYNPNIRGYDEKYDPMDCSQNGTKVDKTVSIRETWEAMEECVKKGKVKAIGLANFNAGMIHDLLSYAKIKPVISQNECHVYLQNPKLVSYLQSENIQMVGYSPLGAGTFKDEDEPNVLQDEVIGKIAKSHNKSAAQVCLRWNIQRGVVVIPKSVHQDRIKENLDVFDFDLAEGELEEIKKINKNYRYLETQKLFGCNIPIFGEF